MNEPAHSLATYQDVLDAPEHLVAEILDGELYLSPRPAGPHSAAASAVGEELGPPFKRGRGGPGGWLILDEPELHFADNVVVPDLAGWRRERLPSVGVDQAWFDLAPDWLCEVLSPSTRRLDRARKLPLYAREGVKHLWLVDPHARMLEVFRLESGKWMLLATYFDDDKVRAEPFDAIELELGILWADVKVG
jgi:Uma2 family endonuclease